MDELDRRQFLESTTLAAGGALLGIRQEPPASTAVETVRKPIAVAILADPADPVASAPAAQWAIEQMSLALAARGAKVRRIDRLELAEGGEMVIVAAGAGSAMAHSVLERAGVSSPTGPEALALARGEVSGRPLLAAWGSDPRGLSYALTELADRVRHATTVRAALDVRRPIAERPFNAVRSIARIFSSEVEDKPWFYDRSFWETYLSMLAAQRFNRFALMLGMAYDFLNEVSDAYFHFAYPFLDRKS